MRISDWSSDVCSSDLDGHAHFLGGARIDGRFVDDDVAPLQIAADRLARRLQRREHGPLVHVDRGGDSHDVEVSVPQRVRIGRESEMTRSEEHTSELQSLMRISYAVFCLKTKKLNNESHKNVKSINNNNNTKNHKT